MNDLNKKVRVRFAPSPTGYMHVGNFRTALYNYLFAKKQGGDFLIRIEDTDQTRFVDGAAEQLLESMRFMGLSWTEGNFLKNDPAIKKSQQQTESLSYPATIEVGQFGPYAQSERTELYKKYAQQLVAQGKAYYCFCDSKRLEQMREEQQKEKKAPMYDRFCLSNFSAEEVTQKLAENQPAVVRLKIPKDETIEFVDTVRGKVSFSSNTIDDQVLMKSDGFPTYHLANVVDDHLMEITHVIRGEDWLPSTPKHILLYRAFGWEVPEFAHLPLLLNPDRSKLSKRQGDVAVEDYLKKGYLKEAILNFVVMLGWNPGEGSTQEVFSMEELIEKFELTKVHKAGAVFDIKKLDWINAQYIKKLSADELFAEAIPFLKEKEFFKNTLGFMKTDEYLKKVLEIEKQRLVKFSDIGDENKFFFENISYQKEQLKWKESTLDETKSWLEKSKTELEKIDEKNWTLENLEKKLLEAAGEKRGDLLWPLRMALTGAQKSPSPFECAWILGKKEVLRRIENAIEL
ncbi:MAG: glutamate--tRNA ligase [bacterium]